jgi:hypothetical protein
MTFTTTTQEDEMTTRFTYEVYCGYSSDGPEETVTVEAATEAEARTEVESTRPQLHVFLVEVECPDCRNLRNHGYTPTHDEFGDCWAAADELPQIDSTRAMDRVAAGPDLTRQLGDALLRFGR